MKAEEKYLLDCSDRGIGMTQYDEVASSLRQYAGASRLASPELDPDDIEKVN